MSETDDGLHPPQTPRLIVTDIGEYIDKGSCERNLKLRLDKGKEARRFPFYGAVRKPMDPILAMNGRALEDRWAKDFSATMMLLDPAESKGDKGNMTWGEFVAAVKEITPEHRPSPARWRSPGRSGRSPSPAVWTSRRCVGITELRS